VEAAGFRLRSPDPDCEDMLYYELHKRWPLAILQIRGLRN
jgi:hypothetical protein